MGVSQNLWRPLGAEADASWCTDSKDQVAVAAACSTGSPISVVLCWTTALRPNRRLSVPGGAHCLRSHSSSVVLLHTVSLPSLSKDHKRLNDPLVVVLDGARRVWS